jgi:ribonuclease R
MKKVLEQLENIVMNYNKGNFQILEFDEITREFYDILLKNGIIVLDKNGKIKKKIKDKVVVGQLMVKPSFGFILASEDVFVKETKGYFDGDIVIATIEENTKFGRSTEGKIFDLVKRGEKLILARVDNDDAITVLNENFAKYKVVFEHAETADEINARQIIQLKVNNVTGKKIICELVRVVADFNDPDLQMKMVLANYGIDTEFNQEALKQADMIKEVEVKELEGRIDLREQMTFTIDGKDAKDLDDAVSLIKETNGYRLTVSIADVSHYITENSPLDQEAYARSTSVYFVDRVVPMIPKKLSNGICSLHPNVDRLTLSCEMLIDFDGNVVDHKIYPSVINSNFRLTYDAVNDMIMDGKIEPEYQIIYSTLMEMNKLRAILNKKRLGRGAFNLEDKDAKFEVDEKGKIVDIHPYSRRNAEKLIEEFMIIANETVAHHIFWMELPFLYRIHDRPNPKKLKDVLQMFQVLGIKVKGDIEDFKPSMFKNALDQIEEPINKRIVSDLIVRSLSKARYQEKNTGHFGLASKNYTHFTSPIRRYPDLVVHRHLRKYLFENNTTVGNAAFAKMNEIGAHTSEKETNAVKAEQTIEDMKKAEYMEQFIGQEFEGYIASILDYGFFVELDNTVRGLIKFGRIKEFTKVVNYKVIFSNKTQLTIGDKIKVVLTEVDTNKGLVEFDIIGYTMLKERRDRNVSGPRSRRKNEDQGPTRFKRNKNKSYRNQKTPKPSRPSRRK